MPSVFLESARLQTLLDVLAGDDRVIIGPTVRDQAVVYDRISSVEELPYGWTDEQEPGRYRLQQSGEEKYFGFAVGPHSWKQYLFPPRTVVATADRVSADEAWQMQTPEPDETRFVFLGVRACELAAIAIQDRVFLEGAFVDPVYESRRRNSLIVAVNCTQAAATCFCTSTDSGPACRSGFDIALTEIEGGFLLESGSESGEQLLAQLECVDSTAAHEAAARAAKQQAVDQISKTMETDDLRNLMLGNLRNEHWNEVASRCLSCSNCTMVCPTCFCATVNDVSDLDDTHIDRERSWDSCFNFDFSYMNDSVVRNSVASRYRQWLTHKLGSWHDQFGQSGCVGCGRCITWCPPGIDLTEEVAALRASDVRQTEETAS